MVKLTRRHILRQGTGLFLTLTPVGAALAKPASPAQFLAVRIWPAHAYTRVTLESNHPMKYQHFMLDNPSRLVVDIQGAEINSVLQGISSKVLSDDPFIRSIRAGQIRPIPCVSSSTSNKAPIRKSLRSPLSATSETAWLSTSIRTAQMPTTR